MRLEFRIVAIVASWVFVVSATSAFAFSIPAPQDSSSSQAAAGSPAASGQPPQSDVTSPAEPKKTKKLWTNDNLTDVSGSAISQVGEVKNGGSGKAVATAKPASPQVIATFRKQLASAEAQLTAIDKQIADLKSFNKGEAPGAQGMQLHKGYNMEPIPDQVQKLEEKRKVLAAQMDAVLDAARKRGIEPGQLR